MMPELLPANAPDDGNPRAASAETKEGSSMPNIQFVLELDRVGPQGNAARMWLDTSRDNLLEPGEEVTLATINSKVWMGNKDVDGATAGMAFLVKFIAVVGAHWSFTAQSGDEVLYQTKDRVTAVASEFLAARLQ
jgi:hypothetical protein